MKKQLVLAAALAAMVFQSVADNTARYKTAIEVVGYSGTSSLSSFPLPVRVSETLIKGFKYADCAADGSDIRFRLPNGRLLAMEIDEWNPEGESLLWVQVPALEKGTVIMMYYCDPTPEETFPPNIWETAGYVGVWHMGDATGSATVADAGPNALHGTVLQTASLTDERKAEILAKCTRVQGPLAGARYNYSMSETVDGATKRCDNYISIPKYTAGSKFTVSGWFRYDKWSDGSTTSSGYSGAGSTPRMFDRKYPVPSAAYDSAWGWAVIMPRQSFTSGQLYGAAGSNFAPTLDTLKSTWRHLAFVYNDTTASCYEDGTAKKNVSGATSGNLSRKATDPDAGLYMFYMGYNGYGDEVRIRKGVSTPDWIMAEYQSGGAGFLAYDEVSSGGYLTVATDGIAYAGTDPAYGRHACGPGETMTCTCPAGTLTNGTWKGVCTGWTLVTASGEKSGTGPVCEYTHNGDATLTWHFASERFRPTLYVATNGDDANDGFSWATAKLKPRTAIDAYDQADIWIAPGTYDYWNTLRVTNGYFIAGAGPGVVLRMTGPSTLDQAGVRAIAVGHDSAVVSNVTVCGCRDALKQALGMSLSKGLVEDCVISNFYFDTQPNAGNGIGCYMSGGTLSRCLVCHNRRGDKTSSGLGGAGVYVGGGLAERCVIRDNRHDSPSDALGGGGVRVNGGTLRNSLVTGNYHARVASGVQIDAGTVDSCTIIGNAGGTGYAAGLQYAGGEVVNTLVEGNLTSAGEAFNYTNATKSAENVTYSFSRFPAISGGTNRTGDPKLGNGNRPTLASPCRNAATVRPWMAGATDLSGAPRIRGTRPDIGCLEADNAGLMLIFR